MSTHAISLYPVLFETLSNNSDEVVIQGLTVLAEIVNCTNKSKGKPHWNLNFKTHWKTSSIDTHFLLNIALLNINTNFRC